jgi:hypothetical protein
MDWLESLVERRIREATERGDFDDLPGAGRPLDLRDADDPDWWIKRLARREQIDAATLLPPTLALRREVEGFPDSLADLTREDQVRAVLDDYNERVRADWRRPRAGPSLPLPAQEVDVEEVVAGWRRRHGHRSIPTPTSAPSAPSAPTAPTAPLGPQPARGRWRAWWARRRHSGHRQG